MREPAPVDGHGASVGLGARAARRRSRAGRRVGRSSSPSGRRGLASPSGHGPGPGSPGCWPPSTPISPWSNPWSSRMPASPSPTATAGSRRRAHPDRPPRTATPSPVSSSRNTLRPVVAIDVASMEPETDEPLPEAQPVSVASSLTPWIRFFAPISAVDPTYMSVA